MADSLCFDLYDLHAAHMTHGALQVPDAPAPLLNGTARKAEFLVPAMVTMNELGTLPWTRMLGT